MKKFIVFIFILVLPFQVFLGCEKKEKIKGQDSYTIDAVFNAETMTLDCSEIVEFIIGDEKISLDVVKLNLYPNAYRKDATLSPIDSSHQNAYINKSIDGGIEIKSVSFEGKPLTFLIEGKDKNILTVKLLKKLKTSEKLRLKIDFKVKIPNVLHRLGYNDKTVNLGNWYPILCVLENGKFYECEYYPYGDPFYSEVANFNINITLPKEYVIASSGKILSTEILEDKVKYEIALKNARDFAMVLSKHFSVIKENYLGKELMYFYYDDELETTNFQAIKSSFKFFSEKFGDYPYESLSVVKTGFVLGGMEYPCLTYISDKLGKEDFIDVIIHENAHQWWYNSVGNNELVDCYLDEGLAEMSLLLFYENHSSYGVTRKEIIDVALKNFKNYATCVKQIMGKVDTRMNRNLAEYKTEYEYVSLAYVKGLLMFDGLRTSIGDKRFETALKKYYKDNLYKNATKLKMVESFNKCGIKVNGYIDSWTLGKAVI